MPGDYSKTFNIEPPNLSPEALEIPITQVPHIYEERYVDNGLHLFFFLFFRDQHCYVL